MSDDANVPKGRWRRLGSLVGMTTRVGTTVAVSAARKVAGKASAPQLEAAQKVLETLGSLKGAAMKAGQTASLFADALGPEAKQILSRLYSQAPTTLPFSTIAAVIDEELGYPWQQAFAEIDPKPLAAASLGQVHPARLPDGTEVVIKVQYPGVDVALKDDLKNAGALVRTLGMATRLLDSREYFEEIEREVSAELDYLRELQQLETFRGYYARFDDDIVPRAWPTLCSRRMLVLERLHGPTLSEYSQNARALSAAERFEVGERLVRAVYAPFLFHRAIHADTHPGNYIVLPGKLGVLDFGSAKHLSEPFWSAVLTSVQARIEKRRIDELALLKAAGFHFDIPDERARERLDEMGAIVGGPLEGPYDFGTDTMVEQMYALKTRYTLDLLRMKPPAESLMFYRAVAGLTQNLRSLGASGDFRPFFRQALAEPR